MGWIKKLFKIKSEDKGAEKKAPKASQYIVSMVKGVVGWFGVVSVLQIVTFIIVGLMLLAMLLPILSTSLSVDTFGQSFDLSNNALMNKKGGCSKDLGQFFTNSEADIAKLNSNYDKNMYRFISLAYQAEKDVGIPCARTIVGTFAAEAGSTFYATKEGNNTKNILKHVSDRRQNGGAARGILQLDSGYSSGKDKKGIVGWGGYKPENGSDGDTFIINDFPPYSVYWTALNIKTYMNNYFKKPLATSPGSKDVWFRFEDGLPAMLKKYGLEDNETTRSEIYELFGYMAHHSSTYTSRKIGVRKWRDACLEAMVASYAASGGNINNITVESKLGFGSEWTKAPFFGKKFSVGRKPNYTGPDYENQDTRFTLKIKGDAINKPFLKHLSSVYADKGFGKVFETALEAHRLAPVSPWNSSGHFDIMQSLGVVVTGNAVIYDMLDKLGVDINSLGCEEETGVDFGGKVPRYYQGDYNHVKYGGKPMGVTGCGPTSLAMVVSHFKGEAVTPEDIVKWSGNRYYVSGAGSRWDIYAAGAKHFNIGKSVVQIGSKSAKARDMVINELKAGRPVISSQSPGKFTSGGHFIVLSGITADGKIMVNDPNKKNAITRGYNERPFDLVKDIDRTSKAYWLFK